MSPTEGRRHSAGAESVRILRAIEFDQVADFHRAWVAVESESEAMVTACLEAYFECETNEIPECKHGSHSLMQEFLHLFMVDPRADDVPKGRNCCDYRTVLWKTGDGEYNLEDCLGIAAKLTKLDAEEVVK